MSQRNYFQLVPSIGLNRGGLTKAVYDRSSVFCESGTKPVFILPFIQPDARSIFEQVQSTGKLGTAVLLSLYEYLSEERGNDGEAVRPLCNFGELRESAHKVTEEHANGNTTRYFKDGIFLGAESYTANNVLTAITYHDPQEPWKPLARDTFNHLGTVVSRTYLDTTFSARYRIYYSHSGIPVLSHWISPAEKNYRFVAYGRKGIARQYNSLEDLQAEWLKKCFENYTPEFIISDEPVTLPFLKAKARTSATRAVAAIHTTHTKDQTSNREYKSWFPQYGAMNSSIDNFVFFTNAQRNDFARDANIPIEKCIVISHPAPLPVESHIEKKGIVTVSRLDKFKRIDDSIKAFSLIADKHPAVNYEIFGTGPEEASLKDLIKSLKLEKRIHLNGYTDKPLECFASAEFSLFTSRYEGFGLTLLESLAQECPVISYEVMYGPLEIIKDSTNGLLVPNGNVEALANAIDRLLSDPALLEHLKLNCRIVNESYDIDNWKSGWQSLLNRPN